jgi:hypothetical protein
VRRGIDDRRKAKERKLRGPEPFCGCEHHLSFHDVESGLCHGLTKVKMKNDSGETIRKEDVTCTCRRYVGPEPLGGFYAPEITS